MKLSVTNRTGFNMESYRHRIYDVIRYDKIRQDFKSLNSEIKQ